MHTVLYLSKHIQLMDAEEPELGGTVSGVLKTP
jgi:hypothetical protein